MTVSHADSRVDDAPPTSELLIRIVERCPEGQVSVGNLIDELGDRAFGIILLILSIPVAIPGPPGLPVIFGTPMLVFAAQLWLGHDRPWLPGFVRRREFPRISLLSVLRRVRPTLAFLENVCRPRLLPLTEPKGERWLGAYILLSCIVLINPVPIPFSHLPLAWALTVLFLGYVERDGWVILGGIVAALAGMAINLSLTGSLLLLGLKFLRHLLAP
jgi:hypothetical protein